MMVCILDFYDGLSTLQAIQNTSFMINFPGDLCLLSLFSGVIGAIYLWRSEFIHLSFSKANKLNELQPLSISFSVLSCFFGSLFSFSNIVDHSTSCTFWISIQ
jgi:hypothetical protein